MPERAASVPLDPISATGDGRCATGGGHWAIIGHATVPRTGRQRSLRMIVRQKHDIVVIGGSSGGIAALTSILERLPADLAAALFVVQHIGDRPSSLPELLSRAGPLQAAHAQNGEFVEHGRVYVAPPGRHMVLQRGRVRLNRAAKEHHTRPAADPLFRSAAASYGPRVVALVLSGGDGDGAQGMLAVTQHGGIGIVQAPDDAKTPSMPERAIKEDHPSYSLAAAAIAPVLIGLINGSGDREPSTRPTDPQETAPIG
jgi:two-component system, chemotaxis family, protein-glutamate methylesterase/glutaminase